MKTSYSWYVLVFLCGGIAMIAAQNALFVKATGQQPQDLPRAPSPDAAPSAENAPLGIELESSAADAAPAPTPTPENRANLPQPSAFAAVEPAARTPIVVLEQQANGVVVQRSSDGRYVPANQFAPGVELPYVRPNGVVGPNYLAPSPVSADPETAKLMNEEMQASQAAQAALAELRSAGAEADKEKQKALLREKLAAIFEIQQKRRAAEVAKIESRLARLKDTMKKRDAAKDSIIDRRLEVLTGGVDELGWEESFAPGVPAPPVSFLGPPTLVPNTLPAPTPARLPATIPGPAAAPPGGVPSLQPRTH